MSRPSSERASPAVLEIRSYRAVFDLERRIYRIDRLRLNPAGVPLRGAVYFALLALAAALLSRVPLLGLLGAALPWYMRDLALPALCAAALAMARIDGRPVHLGLRSLVRHRCGPAQLGGLRPSAPAGTRWWAGELLMLPDGSESGWRRMRFVGPGAVLVHGRHRCSAPRWRSARVLRRVAAVTLHERPDDPAAASRQVILLERGVRLRVRPRRPT